MSGLNQMQVESVVRAALMEDVGSGDITTALTIPDSARSVGVIVAKAEGVIAGIDIVRTVYSILDHSVKVASHARDGAPVKPGSRIATVSGPSRSILTGERVALNFLQRLSGIATATSHFVHLVSDTKAAIVDTRKTTPGLRALEKYAVRIGGGRNHRFALYDGILIKDNHIAAAGGVEAAVKAARKGAPHTMRIEVEVTSLDQLREAIDAGADAVLLDNMSVETMRQAVELGACRVVFEASGGITEANAAAIAATGVDLISVGALTHSVKALDISLEIQLDV